jgi:hypothetical protein
VPLFPFVLAGLGAAALYKMATRPSSKQDDSPPAKGDQSATSSDSDPLEDPLDPSNPYNPYNWPDDPID